MQFNVLKANNTSKQTLLSANLNLKLELQCEINQLLP